MNLYELSASELHEKLVKKEASSTEITKSVIDRINSVEDKISAFITTTFDSALSTAKIVDDKIAKGEAIRPLEGIPMAVKDNMCTKGIPTTSGSKMLENYVPMYNATIIEKLHETNVPILGKTNMDEFAMGSSTETSYFKKTSNPHDITRIPGGSSGGSAASVASNGAVWSLGSDTGGSIRQPAAHCGTYGLKPTYGTVSRFGLIAFASSLDQIGPFTKTATDCATAFELLAGHDKMDSTSYNIEYPKYTDALNGDIKGLKIGVPTEYMSEGISEEIKNAIENAIKVYESLGATVEYCSLPLTEYFLPTYYIIGCAEASSNLARFDGIKYGYRTQEFTDLDNLYKKTRSEGFGPEVKRRIILGTYVLASGYYDAYYKKAQQVRTIIKNNFATLLEKYDVLLTPVTMNTAFQFGEKMDDPIAMYKEDLCTVSINIAGVPALAVPCATSKNNLPIGMQLIGRHFDEETLFKFARNFEKASSFVVSKANL